MPTLIQTASGGFIALQPQISTIGSAVASPVCIPTSVPRLPLAITTVVSSNPATTLVSSLPTSLPLSSSGGKLAGGTSHIKQHPQLLPKQSNSSMGKGSRGAAVAQLQQQQPAAVAASPTATHLGQTFTTGASQPLLLSTGGAVLQTLQGVTTAAPQHATMLGQTNLLLGSATGQTSSPILIHQPTGNPLIMVRSNPPTIQQSTPTILPIVSQAAPGTPTAAAPGTTLLFQQPQPAAPGAPGAGGVITAQPQVKIITPQGRMQVQQIQTPTGTKLITVPVGQGQTTLIPQTALQAASPAAPIPNVPPGQHIGQIQQIASGGATAFASIGNSTIVSSLPNTTTLAAASASATGVLPTSLIQSVPTMGGMGLPTSASLPSTPTTQPFVGTPIPSTTQQQPINVTSNATSESHILQPTPKSYGSAKIKKSKRRSKKPDPMAAATTAVVNSALEAVGQKPPTTTAKSAGLDLGELMKDVGLDLEGFGGVDEASAQAALSAAGNITPATHQALPIAHTQQILSASHDGSAAVVGGPRLSFPSGTPHNSSLQGTIQIPGDGTFSMSGPTPGIVSVSGGGTTTFPVIGNTQPLGTATVSLTGGAPGSIMASPGNQLVAQLQQPLPLQVKYPH